MPFFIVEISSIRFPKYIFLLSFYYICIKVLVSWISFQILLEVGFEILLYRSIEGIEGFEISKMVRKIVEKMRKVSLLGKNIVNMVYGKGFRYSFRQRNPYDIWPSIIMQWLIIFVARWYCLSFLVNYFQSFARRFCTFKKLNGSAADRIMGIIFFEWDQE